MPERAFPAADALVSVVVPCRNERRHIEACLDSILGGDLPPGRLEVLVVDGMSDDGTREVVAGYAERHACVRLLDNPRRITPCALNIGIRAARGDVVVRMDAHTRYPRHYVGALVAWLERSGADNVGGPCITRPGGDGARARAIAAALGHPLGVGNSLFRIGVTEPRWVDTVPFGCYRRRVFERIGLFDEELVRNQDDEFNHRLLKHGGRILLVPDVTSEYVARDSIAKVARMFYQYGYFKPLVARKVGGVFTARQLVPPLFVLALGVGALLLAAWPAGWPLVAGGGALYALVCLAAAARPGAPLDASARLLLPAVLPVIHTSYGLGFLRGALDFLVRRRTVANPDAVPVTR